MEFVEIFNIFEQANTVSSVKERLQIMIYLNKDTWKICLFNHLIKKSINRCKRCWKSKYTVGFRNWYCTLYKKWLAGILHLCPPVSDINPDFSLATNLQNVFVDCLAWSSYIKSFHNWGYESHNLTRPAHKIHFSLVDLQMRFRLFSC